MARVHRTAAGTAKGPTRPAAASRNCKKRQYITKPASLCNGEADLPLDVGRSRRGGVWTRRNVAGSGDDLVGDDSTRALRGAHAAASDGSRERREGRARKGDVRGEGRASRTALHELVGAPFHSGARR